MFTRFRASDIKGTGSFIKLPLTPPVNITYSIIVDISKSRHFSINSSEMKKFLYSDLNIISTTHI